MLRLVVSDLDGTLLRKGERALDCRIFRAVSGLKRSGIRFAVASGRTYHDLKYLFAPVCDDILFLCLDGALTVRREETRFQYPLDEKDLAALTSRGREQGMPGILYCGKYMSYYLAAERRFAVRAERNFRYHAMEIAGLEEIPEPVYKIAFYGGKDFSLPETAAPNLKKVYADTGWIEFVARGVDKGAALERVQDSLGISKAETAVFGDNWNDLGMLARAEHSYAVSWAKPEVLAASRYSTVSVADTLEQWMK